MATHECKNKQVPNYVKQEQLEERRKKAKEKRERRNQLKKYFKHLEEMRASQQSN